MARADREADIEKLGWPYTAMMKILVANRNETIEQIKKMELEPEPMARLIQAFEQHYDAGLLAVIDLPKLIKKV